jgi:hypothetical protein
MQYFDPSADIQERIGKVIGDLFSASILLTLIIIFTYSMIFR